MTGTSSPGQQPVSSRFTYDPETFRIDKVTLRIRPGVFTATHMTLHNNGQFLVRWGIHPGQHYWGNNRITSHIDRFIEDGTAEVYYDTEFGTFKKGEEPSWLSDICAVRDIFDRRRSTPLPTLSVAEERRAQVETWARENTDPRIMMRFVINPDRASSPSLLDNRVREKGQMWWEFVLMTLAAAQTDAWLEDDSDVWEAIERNMEVDVEEFFIHCDVDDWNEPAAYMHALSRVYKAAPLLNDAPIEVTVDGTTLPNLHAGSDAAKAIIYRA